MSLAQIKTSMVLVALCAFVFGCSSVDQDEALQKRQAQVIGHVEAFEKRWDDVREVDLSLRQALDMGIRENLDARIAALEIIVAQDDVVLEKLSALPNLDATFAYVGRTNEGASSSRSFLTGSQSLASSVSSDQYRRVIDLDASMDLLDTALAVYRSKVAEKEALVLGQRHRTVLANVFQDVYAAYLRAWIMQEEHEKIDELIARIEDHLVRLDVAKRADLLGVEDVVEKKSNFLEAIRSLHNLKEDITNAESELKGLLSIPHHVDLTLREPDYAALPSVKRVMDGHLAEMELKALQSNPDIYEALLSSEIAESRVQEEILRTFPGLNLFYGFNQDSNSFLEHHRWVDFSATLAQSLISVFTLPKRYEAAENIYKVEERRLLALSAAIITQVHLARERLNVLEDSLDLAKRNEFQLSRLKHAVSEKHKLGFVSGESKILTDVKVLEGSILSEFAKADLQRAMIEMVMLLGYDVDEILGGGDAI